MTRNPTHEPTYEMHKQVGHVRAQALLDQLRAITKEKALEWAESGTSAEHVSAALLTALSAYVSDTAQLMATIRPPLTVENVLEYVTSDVLRHDKRVNQRGELT